MELAAAASERLRSSCSARRSTTGLVYDDVMMKHRNEVEPGHPEAPERIADIWKVLEARGLCKRCKRIESRPACEEEMLAVHSEQFLSMMAATRDLPQDKLDLLSTCYDSIYINQHTYTSSVMAAGCVLQMTEAVVTGAVSNGMAVVRPPGHHVERSKCMGFCHLNSIAIAARHALDKLGLKRILIVDWDIHHGNGIQHHFYEDSRVLYFSLHRYDNGLFFPCSKDANYDQIGSGGGAGYNFNVAWNGEAKGDSDYLLAFYQVLMPVAMEFNPEVVMVACGFDAGEGDSMGGYHVSPAGFAHMTRLLMSLAQGRLVMALEGGYTLSVIQESMCAVVSALLGDDPLPALQADPPVSCAVESIRNTALAHARYWKSLSVFLKSEIEETTVVVKHAACETPESGAVEYSHGRSGPSRDLSEVLPLLGLPMADVSSHGNKSHDQTASRQEGAHGSHDASSGSYVVPASGLTLSQQKIVQSLEENTTMFAVCPKPWCEHLASHVKPLPSAGIDSSQPCQTCGATQEPWVCLTCYNVFCGRYVNQHMVVHKDSTGHMMALSMADLSVWCYQCDSYVDNHVLRPAINSAHHSKFGCYIDGTTF